VVDLCSPMLWRKAERGEIKDKIVHEYNKKKTFKWHKYGISSIIKYDK